MFPDLDGSLKDLQPDHFDGETRLKLAEYIFKGVDKPYRDVPKELQDIEDYVKIVLFKTEELYDAWSASDRMIEAVGLAHRLTRDHTTKRKQQITKAIHDAEERGDEQQKEKLLREFNSLITKD